MNKLILITGGTKGIGKSLAQNLLTKGACVIVTSRKCKFSTLKSIPSGLIQQQLDVTNELSVKRLFNWIADLEVKL